MRKRLRAQEVAEPEAEREEETKAEDQAKVKEGKTSRRARNKL